MKIAGLLVWILITSFSIRAGEDDPLDKRQFNSSLSEVRNEKVVKKVNTDLIIFKNGKVSSRFIKEKFGFKWLRYRILRDTSYIDETQTNVRLLEVAAFATNENNLTVAMEFTVLEWDLDGTVKITKNDKVKRNFALSGREKGGKPKKIKAKSQKVFLIKK